MNEQIDRQTDGRSVGRSKCLVLKLPFFFIFFVFFTVYFTVILADAATTTIAPLQVEFAVASPLTPLAPLR
ncbi:hypothetical protein ACTXT7_016759 [Hymenolepis weldensis]